MAANALGVWMNGVLVGTWALPRQGGGFATFEYEAAWVASAASRALSLSLPITSAGVIRGPEVDHYFDNLLPDSIDIRRRLGRRFSTRSTSAHDLLAAIGRDCVGAVQLLPDGEAPEKWNRIEAEKLTESDVERHLQSVTSADPVAGESADDDFRISIAGAQEKTALLRMGNHWFRPHGATPTTHILKLPLGLVGNMRADMSLSVENEWLCAQLLAAFGLPMAQTDMETFGGRRVLVVRRFDRRWQGVTDEKSQKPGFKPPATAWIARLPQEDFCQALGLPSRLKYQSDGGPGSDDILRVLSHGDQSQTDRLNFVRAQFAFWLLAATDGHAKNFSIAHRRGGAFGLTPLYDVISAWPIIGTGAAQVAYQRARLAMALRGRSPHYKLGEIRARHWLDLANRAGAPEAVDALGDMAAQAGAVLEKVEGQLPPSFPAPVWNKVSRGVLRHAQQYLRERAVAPAA
jgi:serine/threonine-protein kinase HipA